MGIVTATTTFNNGFSSFVLGREEVILNPSPTEPAVVRWTSDRNGVIRILAKLSDLDHNANCMSAGDGINWTVSLNSVVLTGGSGSVANTVDGDVFNIENVSVVPGSTIDFSVDNGGAGNHICDGTNLDVLITSR